MEEGGCKAVFTADKMVKGNLTIQTHMTEGSIYTYIYANYVKATYNYISAR